MMNTKIKTTGVGLTDDVHSYLNKRLSFIEQLINAKDKNVLCEVELSKTTGHHKQGDIYRAEVNLKVGGRNFYAHSEQENINAAIDVVKDEMAKELRRNKDKKQTLVRKGGIRIKQILKGLKW